MEEDVVTLEAWGAKEDVSYGKGTNMQIATPRAIIVGSLDIERRPTIKSRMTSAMESCSKETVHYQVGW